MEEEKWKRDVKVNYKIAKYSNERNGLRKNKYKELDV